MSRETARAEWMLRRLAEQHRRQLEVAGPALMEAARVLSTPPPEPAASVPPPVELKS